MNKQCHISLSCLLFSALLALSLPSTALAYIGPGAGLGAIGTVIAIIGAALLLIVGFVWYPAKRLLRRCKNANDPASDDKR